MNKWVKKGHLNFDPMEGFRSLRFGSLVAGS